VLFRSICSAACTRLKFATAQAARLAYEQLRHRLEPRRGHPVHFDAGSLLVLMLGAGLAMLNLIELSGVLGGPRSVPPALAAAAVWLTGAWLAASAVRHRRRAVLAGLSGAAVLLGLLLVALHGLGPHPGWPASGHALGSTVFAALTGTFILVLTIGAAALMTHMEPASLLMARRRWHRARTAYEEAVEIEHADIEAAAVAAEAWLALVRSQVTALAAGDESLVQPTVGLAAVLVESSRPKLPPAL